MEERNYTPFEKAKRMLAVQIAGEIVLSNDPGVVIQKWRTIFKIPQRRLAQELGIMPSVISDYESGRRKSPGVKFIRKLVDAILNIDEKRGGEIIKEYSTLFPEEKISDVILSMKEFDRPVSLEKFAETIDGSVVINSNVKKYIFGYTIIDSVRAIIELSPAELVKMYGLTTERALIFTNITHGRSPFIAIKVTNLRPGVVVFHEIDKLDSVGKRIAEVENIPVILSKIRSVEEIIKRLKVLE